MALKIAIDLLHVPSQARLLRSQALPDGVEMLLRLAAGEPEAERAAIDLTGRSREVLRQAASFFIEQVLFAPESDSYRVLGANARASASELRRNVALLLRWLHPDMGAHDERAIFVDRVTVAWNNLKTRERRAAYDAQLQSSGPGGVYHLKNRKFRSWRRSRTGLGGKGYHQTSRSSGPRGGLDAMGFLRRALSIVLQRPLVR
jgi:hypothetical protein